MAELASETAAKDPSGETGIGLWQVAILALGLSIFVSFLTLIYGGKIGAMIGIAPAHGSFFVLDSNRIVEVAMDSLLKDPNMNPQVAADAGVQIAKKIQAIIDERVAKGQVIINADVVIGWPESSDITAEVASEIGIHLQ